ncbi:MAG: NUDIX domain-containing protein [bacterium]|nr:NUDIX domain-containing protein [bacterium]
MRISFLRNGGRVWVNKADFDESLIYSALESDIFRNWFSSIDPRFQLRSIEVQGMYFKGGNVTADSLLFFQLLVDMADCPYLQVVILRSKSVTILPILHCNDEDYVVLVRQPRIASGHYDLPELPAGMIEKGSQRSAAMQELEQEVGLLGKVTLVNLTAIVGAPNGVFASPGIINEQVTYYLEEREVTVGELASLQGKTTGITGEGEKIRVQVVPLAKVWKNILDGKILIALALYHYYKKTVPG